MNDRQPELKIGAYRLISVTPPTPLPSPDSGPPLRSRMSLILERDDGESDVLKFDRAIFIRDLSRFMRILPVDIQIISVMSGSIRVMVELPATAARDLYTLAGDTLQELPASANTSLHYRSGQQVKDYELQEQIGVGASGAVYRAYQPKVMRDVAIKIILPSYASQPEFIQRFEREARLVARLEHMNIVPLYDFWQDEQGAYLVMRWLRGGSLRTRLRQQALELPAIARILDQICSALDFAHQQGIVHRDIKPDNILLDDAGNAYLSDFGIAKDVGGTFPVSSQGIMDGTPHYMSPEPFRDLPVTSLSDIYSLGIVLYELLTGERPVANLPMSELVYKKLHDPLPPLGLRRSDLPDAVNQVVQQATAKEPAFRFSDASSFALAFRRAIQPSQFLIRVEEDRTPVITANIFGKLKAKLYDRADLILEKPRLLIGRDDLVEQVEQLLKESDRVLLQGLGGMGKTSLAATIAAHWIESGYGSVVWLEAANENADTLFEAIGRVFGEQEIFVGKLGDERSDTLRRLLSDQKVLIVIDNIWNERALYELLKGLPPTTPALMTSRHALPIDGDIIDVDALSPEKALELLSYHARQILTADAAHLCRMLGCHPFALEIAGKRLKVNKTMTPAQLMTSINDAPHELHMPDNFADVGRKGIKDLLDASFNELSQSSREIFTLMGGFFASIASIEFLMLAADLNQENCNRILSDLEQRGLIDLNEAANDTPAHYRLHDLTYSYARSLYKATNNTRSSIIAAACVFANEHDADFDILEFEQVNLIGAARAAQAENQTKALIDIMYTLAVKGYMDTRGHTLLLLEQLDEAISAARQLQPQPMETLHYLLGKRGNAFAARNDLAGALKAYQEAVSFAPNPNRKAILNSVIGAYCFPDNPDAADRYFDEAYQIAKSHHDDLALSVILEHRGHQAINRKDQETARGFFAEALEVAERLQNSERLFYALLNLGARESQLGLLKEALSNHQRAYELAQASRNHLWIGAALQCIGEDYHGLGEREKARESLSKALSLLKRFGATAMVGEIARYMQAEGYPIPEA